MNDQLIIHGARENNLKNVNLTIPRDKLVVFTGLSGSGKSSLAFDTIYAEGQRRYVESLSSLCPAVSGADGQAGCGRHRRPVSRHFHRPENHIQKSPLDGGYGDGDLRLSPPAVGPGGGAPLSPVRERDPPPDHRPDCGPGDEPGGGCPLPHPVPGGPGKKGEHRKVLEDARKAGFARIRADGILYDLNEEIPLEKNKKHTIELVVDRLVLRPDLRRRLADSLRLPAPMQRGPGGGPFAGENRGIWIFSELRLPRLWHQPVGAGTPDVLLQHALRRLPRSAPAWASG